MAVVSFIVVEPIIDMVIIIQEQVDYFFGFGLRLLEDVCCRCTAVNNLSQAWAVLAMCVLHCFTEPVIDMFIVIPELVDFFIGFD